MGFSYGSLAMFQLEAMDCREEGAFCLTTFPVKYSGSFFCGSESLCGVAVVRTAAAAFCPRGGHISMWGEVCTAWWEPPCITQVVALCSCCPAAFLVS